MNKENQVVGMITRNDLTNPSILRQLDELFSPAAMGPEEQSYRERRRSGSVNRRFTFVRDLDLERRPSSRQLLLP